MEMYSTIFYTELNIFYKPFNNNWSDEPYTQERVGR